MHTLFTHVYKQSNVLSVLLYEAHNSVSSWVSNNSISGLQSFSNAFFRAKSSYFFEISFEDSEQDANKKNYINIKKFLIVLSYKL